MGAGVLNTYPDLLPVTSATPIITMGEGDTPLVRSNRLGRELGCTELYFKLEGCNPTGSFKDRGMVMAIAKALEEGTKAIMCASTGNTSASAAAFGAYCDIPTFVLIPKGEVAMGKLAQAMIYGAKVIMINGNFDAALGMVREFTQRNDVTLVNSVNPHRIEGQKTAAFEIVDKLGGAPDMLFIPVGNAGNITAYWKGFREYQDLGRSQALPRMMGFQAEGAAPIVRGEPVARPQTIASAIRIGNPATWNGAIEARDGSGGVIDAVSDDEILEAYRLLANKEGIFCEPASAASFAGLLKMHRQGMDLSDKRIVCICTGNGLKDPDLAVSSSGGQTIEVPANIEALEAVTIGSES
ncbi:MAG: threonine synthase [Chloroflexota bacterium]|nr:threonine synthase [Chloroflexota bacterium]